MNFPNDILTKHTLDISNELVAHELPGGASIFILNNDFDSVTVRVGITDNIDESIQLSKELRGRQWLLKDCENQPVGHEHFYIWTQGTSAQDLELEVSTDASVVEYILGGSGGTIIAGGGGGSSDVTKAYVDAGLSKKASTTYVNSEIANLDTNKADKSQLADYTTTAQLTPLLNAKADTADLTALSTQINNKLDASIIVDYSTTDEMNTAIDSAKQELSTEIANKASTTDLQAKADATAVNSLSNDVNALQTALNDKVSTADFNQAKQELQDAIDNVDVDLTGYATETFVATEIGKLNIPSIDGLATEQYVDDAIAQASIQGGNGTADVTKAYVDSELNKKLNIADAIDAYSKTETDDLLAEKADASELAGLATEAFVTTALADYTATANLTTLLDGKADKTQLTGLATETFVNTALDTKADKTQLTGLATEQFVIDSLADKADSASVTQELNKKANLTDLANYTTTADLTTLLADKANTSDLQGLATEAFVTRKIADAAASGTVDLDGYATEQFVTNAINNIPAPDLSDYVVQSDLETALNDKADKSQLTGLATEAFVTTEIGKLTIPSITGLATEQFVTDAIDAIPATDLSNYVTKTGDVEISGTKTFTSPIILPTPTADTHAVTKAYVDTAVANVDVSAELANYTTTADLTTLLDAKADATDLQGLATESYVQEQIANIPETDISGKLDITDFNTAKATLESSIADNATAITTLNSEAIKRGSNSFTNQGSLINLSIGSNNTGYLTFSKGTTAMFNIGRVYGFDNHNLIFQGNNTANDMAQQKAVFANFRGGVDVQTNLMVSNGGTLSVGGVDVMTKINENSTAITTKADSINTYTKSEVDEKIRAASHYKGVVPTRDDLPADNNTTGDIRIIQNENNLMVAWNGTSWDTLSHVEMDMTDYVSNTQYTADKTALEASINDKVPLTTYNDKVTELTDTINNLSIPSVDGLASEQYVTDQLANYTTTTNLTTLLNAKANDNAVLKLNQKYTAQNEITGFNTVNSSGFLAWYGGSNGASRLFVIGRGSSTNNHMAITGLSSISGQQLQITNFTGGVAIGTNLGCSGTVTFTGQLTLGSITNVGTYLATLRTDVDSKLGANALNGYATEQFVTDAIDAIPAPDLSTLVDLTTDQSVDGNKTFTAPITTQTPTEDAHATTKAYVDTAISAVDAKADTNATDIQTINATLESQAQEIQDLTSDVALIKSQLQVVLYPAGTVLDDTNLPENTIAFILE